MFRLFVLIFEIFCILINILYIICIYLEKYFLINSYICIYLSIIFWGKYVVFVIKLFLSLIL